MFGFKLIRKRKIDEEDLEVFKKSIETINKICDDSIEKLQGDKFNPGDLMVMIELLSVHLPIYKENKFSLPSSAFNLDKELSELSDDIDKIFILLKYIAGEEQDRFPIGKLDECEHLMFLGMNSIVRHIKSIKYVISFDTCRINYGIDIIRDYYYRKRMKFKHKCDSSMTIYFKKKPNKRG